MIFSDYKQNQSINSIFKINTQYETNIEITYIQVNENS